jgi:hypothetical protein
MVDLEIIPTECLCSVEVSGHICSHVFVCILYLSSSGYMPMELMFNLLDFFFVF